MRVFLKEARKKKGLTQNDVADAAGMNRAAYSNIEIGKRSPSVKLAKKIAEVLGFNWTKFYEE